MATPKQVRTRGRLSLLLGAILATVLFAAVAYADNTISDGDGVVPFADNNMAVGNVACGVATNKTAPVLITRNGSGTNVFKDGSTATITVASVTGSGLSASMGASNTITLPSNWGSQPNNTLSSSVSSTVTVNSSTPGPGSGAVTYRATGVNSSNATITREDTMNVTWTTGTCVVPDTTPPSVAITSPANGSSTANSSINVSGTASDAGSGIESVKVNGNTATLGAGSSWSDNGLALACGSNTITAVARDNAGNSSNASVGVTRTCDTTAPVITPHISGTLGDNDWYTSNVSVTWDVVDNESDISSSTGCGSTTVTGDTAGTTLTCSATSAGGTSSDSVTVKRDATNPTITASRSPGANSNGWNSSNVTVSYTCADALSGIASCSLNDEVASEGANLSTSGAATDKAGNTASVTVNNINIDKTAPTISATVSPGANGNGWHNSNVTVNYTCNDATSGIDSCGPDDLLTSEGANQSSSGTAKDMAGNTASVTVNGINIDKTAPTITASRTPAANGNGWNNEDVTVSYSCADALSGLASCPANDTLTANGANQSASGTATDKAGNTATDGISGINIDKIAPTISATRSPAANANGWNNTAVAVNFICSDSLSGVDGACGPNTTLNSEGAGQSASGSVVDKAGNTNSATISNIDIDLTNPSVSLVGGPAANGSYYFGSVPAEPTCNASDALSGLAGSCSVSGYSTAVGTHTVIASANDKAGNSNSASRTYTVLPWALRGFYAPVDMGTSVVNTIKGGSTVPLKFEIFAGSNEMTDTVAVTSLLAKQVPCTNFGGDAIDEIEVTATGGTSLRYDSTGGQFIYNWKTPTGAGKCFVVTMTTDDGSKLSAQFKTK